METRSEAREVVRALVVLSSAAAKRLIGRAVAHLPQVEKAKKEGLIVVGLGTTNAYVLEELLGEPVEKGRYCAGYVGKKLGVVPAERRLSMVVLERGQPKTLDWPEILARLSPGDLVIKGGNILDPEGVVGVFVAADDGGTVGKFYPAALARGVEVIIPISRAKSVHFSVSEIVGELGKGRLKWASGSKVGVFPLLGTVITETEAVELLYDVEAWHLATGGVGEGKGAVVLLLRGEEEKVRRAFEELARLSETEKEPAWEEE